MDITSCWWEHKGPGCRLRGPPVRSFSQWQLNYIFMVTQIRLTCSVTQARHSAQTPSAHLLVVCLPSRNCSFAHMLKSVCAFAFATSRGDTCAAPQLIRLNAAETYDDALKPVNASPKSPARLYCATSKKSGDAADRHSGVNPSQASERDAGRGRGLGWRAEPLVSSTSSTLFLKQINQPRLFTGGFTTSNKKNI